ncbi:MAG: alpha/beta hydrolase fold domain-containing protein [Flavobacterium sp.]
MKQLAAFFLLLMITTSATAQDFKTINYFVNDTTKLELDLFLPKNTGKQKLPLLIFMHGGGFGGGKRADGHHICSYAAQHGYAAASITYTLYMKGRNFGCDGKLPQKIRAFQMAANDLWQATLFFTKNAAKYNIDPTKIFIGGNSAGAEAALHGAYWDRNVMSVYPEKLPADFKYAGVISGAGALQDLNLITKKTMVPMLLFHGSVDPTVPYDNAAHHYCPTNASNWLMLFGGYAVFKHVAELQGTARMVTFCGGGHEYSDHMFGKDQAGVVSFMDRVLKGERFYEHTIIPTGKSGERDDKYGFCD